MATKPSRRLIERLRHSNNSGRVIARHRALRTLDFRTASLLHPTLLLIGSYVVLTLALAPIESFWREVLGFALPHLLDADEIAFRPTPIMALITASMPFPVARGAFPSETNLILAGAVALVAMLLSYVFLRRNSLPMRYVLWAIGLVQIFACALFYFAPNRFPHHLASHVADGFGYAINLIFVAPLILAVTYSVFDRPLLNKAAGTFVILLTLVIVTPCQYLLHIALIQNFSLVVLPILFIFFGLLFNIAVFIAVYAWCVSWRT